MRFLVLGSVGMAGHVITHFLRERGHDVDGVARRSPAGLQPTFTLDVRDLDRLGHVLAQGHYDVVVNCVGLLITASNQRPAEAVEVNAHLPQWLAAKLSGSPTRLFHLSTDCVFSGEAGPYLLTDAYDGQRLYDRSKALGEVRNNKDLTLRMSIIGPELAPDGTGLFHWVMQQDGEIEGWTSALWNGISTIELARCIERLSDAQAAGVIHLVPQQHLTKFELVSRLVTTFGRPVQVRPVPGHAVDKRLVPDSRQAVAVQNYDTMMTEMRHWVLDHAQLYRHYGL